MFFSCRTLNGFWPAIFETPTCMRCSSRIRETEIWEDSYEETSGEQRAGKYAALAQVFKKNRLSGGLLCEKCIVSFRFWMKEGEKV